MTTPVTVRPTVHAPGGRVLVLQSVRVLGAELSRNVRNIRLLMAFGGGITVFTLGGCAGGQPKVGDCLDSHRHVVECGSSSATMKLVSDQSLPNAIACVEIGNRPQVSVKIGHTTFCAESVSASH
jgi:hypothetical protein